MPTYLTRERVKRTLGIPSGVTHHDTRIDDLLDGAEQSLHGYLGLPGLTLTTYVETHDVGHGQNWIAPRGFPIVSVAALTDNGAAVAAADYQVYANDGYVRLNTAGAFFTEGAARVGITYTAGRSPVPARFVEAAAQLAARSFNAGPRTGMTGFGSGSARFDLDPNPIPASVQMLVFDDRRVLPRSGIAHTAS